LVKNSDLLKSPQRASVTAITGVGTPSCAPLGTGRVVCLAISATSKLSSVVGL
jgi:hypothetical protein